ncbi:MAG: hypothetical protein ACRCYD_05535 [Plesiomonas sp.]
MTQYIKHMLWDLIIWVAIYTVFAGLQPWAGYAENGLSFIGVFYMVIGILLMLTYKHVAAANKDDLEKFKPRPVWYSTYCVTSTMCEVVLFAVLGWYWVAAGWIIAAVGSRMFHDELQKLRSA